MKPVPHTLQPPVSGSGTSIRFSSSFYRMVQHPKVREYALLIPISLALTALKVMMHSRAYRQEGFSQSDQKLLFTQEAVRQTISTGLWLIALCTSYELVVKRGFRHMTPMGQVLMSNVVSSIPDTFVRPFLTAKIAKWLLGDTRRPRLSKPVTPVPPVDKTPVTVNVLRSRPLTNFKRPSVGSQPVYPPVVPFGQWYYNTPIPVTYYPLNPFYR